MGALVPVPGAQGDSRRKRPSQDEMLRRVATIVEKMLDGDGPELLRTFVRHQWGVSQGQAKRYVRKARDWLKANTEKKLEQVVALHDNQLRQLWKVAYRKAKQTGQPAAIFAAAAVKQLEMKLQGLVDGKGRFPDKRRATGGSAEAADILARAREAVERHRRRRDGGSDQPPGAA